MTHRVLAILLAPALLLAQAPDLARLRRDVHTLASPAFEGRATGTPGQHRAAAYIAKRMKANGLKPLRGPGMGGLSPYHFAYALERVRFEPTKTTLRLGGVDLRFGEDFQSFITEPTEGEALFLGYGLKAPEAGWDDYQGADLKGKWVVALTGLPPQAEARLREAFPQAGAVEASRLKAAQEAGALGLILVQGAHPGEPDLRTPFSRFARRLQEPQLRLKGGDGERRLPRMIGVFPSGARALGLEVEALQKALDDSGRPAAPRSLGPLALHWSAVTEPVQASDVVGLVPGTDPKLKEEVVLISAHHDHLGLEGGTLHPGADDDASGTAGILETARLLRRAKPKRTLLFLSVSGEENGLFGSEAFTRLPPLPLDRVVADLNLDMIGRGRPDELHVTPARIEGAVTTLTAEARRIAEAQGFPLSCGAEGYWRRSDHYNFVKKGIPAVFFFAGMHEDYHRSTDTADKIDYRKLARVVKVTRDLALAVANAPGRPQPVPREVYEGWTWTYTSTGPEPGL